MKLPPVKYLILTHYHWDHILGLNAWNAITIAHLATEEYITDYCDMRYDDASLEMAMNKGIYNEGAIHSIKTEIEDRDNFVVGKINIFYHDNMKIDLGGISCELHHIESPHTEDTTMVYVPDEKTMFLGDCLYGRRKDGFNYYEDTKLFKMIDTIEQYATDYYLCSHETLCPRDEIVEFWQQLHSSYEVACRCTNLQEAILEYKSRYQVESTNEIEYFLKSFGLR
jgi:glyoxylase-like metal-dependent hydrolase (beta-lactamase superfamily II)